MNFLLLVKGCASYSCRIERAREGSIFRIVERIVPVGILQACFPFLDVAAAPAQLVAGCESSWGVESRDERHGAIMKLR